jgi:hypothetical protein
VTHNGVSLAQEQCLYGANSDVLRWSAGAKGPASSTEFTLLSLSSPSKTVWTAHGASGAFAGLEDEQYAVLSNSGNTVRVYATQPSDGKPTMLRKLELGGGGAAALFPGPPWASLPRYHSKHFGPICQILAPATYLCNVIRAFGQEVAGMRVRFDAACGLV